MNTVTGETRSRSIRQARCSRHGEDELSKRLSRRTTDALLSAVTLVRESTSENRDARRAVTATMPANVDAKRERGCTLTNERFGESGGPSLCFSADPLFPRRTYVDKCGLTPHQQTVVRPDVAHGHVTRLDQSARRPHRWSIRSDAPRGQPAALARVSNLEASFDAEWP